MTGPGSKEGVSLPEVTVNVSGKVLNSAEMDEWDDKQVCCVCEVCCVVCVVWGDVCVGGLCGVVCVCVCVGRCLCVCRVCGGCHIH